MKIILDKFTMNSGIDLLFDMFIQIQKPTLFWSHQQNEKMSSVVKKTVRNLLLFALFDAYQPWINLVTGISSASDGRRFANWLLWIAATRDTTAEIICSIKDLSDWRRTRSRLFSRHSNFMILGAHPPSSLGVDMAGKSNQIGMIWFFF